MGRPRLSTLWASGAAGMYLRSRGEEEVEVLCRLLAARSGVGAGIAPWSQKLAGIPEISLRSRPTGLPDPGQKCRSEIRFSATRTSLN